MDSLAAPCGVPFGDLEKSSYVSFKVKSVNN